MIFRYIGIFALLLIPIGIYIFFFIRRTLNFWVRKLQSLQDSRKGRIIYYVLLALLTALIMYMCVNVFSMSSMIILHILASSAVIEIVNIIVKRIYKATKKNHEKSDTKEDTEDIKQESSKPGGNSKNQTGKKIWNVIYRSGLLPLVITAFIMIYGTANMGNVVEKDYTIYTKKQIRSEGYTIVLVSDLHLGNSMDADKLKDVFVEIEQTQPDMIVLCGDIFDEQSKYTEMQKAAKIFGEAQSTYGTFYVYGNHDRASYRRNADFTPKQLEECFNSNGIQILTDDIYKINDEFTIIGREDARFAGMLGETGGRESISELIGGVDSEDFILVLDHQPVEFEANISAGVDLQLSGHTHGGQIWPVGLISDLLGFGELNYGYKQIDDFQVIVSSGISGWGYPIRTGSQSEYVVVKVLPFVSDLPFTDNE